MSTVPTDTSTPPTSPSACMSAPPVSPAVMLCYRLELQPCLDWLYHTTNCVMDDITDSDANQLQDMPSPVMLFRLTQDIVALCDFVLTPNMMPDVPQDWEPDVAARRYVERIIEFNMEHLALCANPDTLRALNFLWVSWTAYLNPGQGEKREGIQNERTNNADIWSERTNGAVNKQELSYSPDINNERASYIQNLADSGYIQNLRELADRVRIKSERADSANIKTEERAESINIKTEPGDTFIKTEPGDTFTNRTHSSNNVTIGRDAMRHEGARSKARNNKFWTPQELNYVEKIYHEHDGIRPGDAAKMFNDHFRGKTIDGFKPKKRTMHAIAHKFKDLKIKQTAQHVKQEKREESD